MQKESKQIYNFRTKTGEDGVPLGKALDEIEEKKVRELEETIRMKNKQIQSLLEDIDQVEKESVDYQNKVVELRDQMAETTKQINAMTGKYSPKRNEIILGISKTGQIKQIEEILNTDI